MTPVPESHYLIFSLILFSAGIFGALTRRNALGVLIALELMLNAVALNFVIFSRTAPEGSASGQVSAFFIIALAAAGAAAGLAIVLAVYRSRKSIQTDDTNLLKW
ncbi:MAG: NADH-quinone oxidoreductase subunit NuoK [Candidatus Omnitrophica bacterium]|nr:NADH-quinone oxidoreductase subunit NuoK [Candidatus Omnitrophota bacterium]